MQNNPNYTDFSYFLSESDLKRFWEKVDILGKDDCWEWKAGKSKDGYGRFKLRGKTYYAHRISWFLKNGTIPHGILVCHDCDNPSCENPSHFFLGTNKNNRQDASKKGRLPTGEKHWSRVNPEKLARGDNNGSRTHPEKMPRRESHGMSKFTNFDILSIRKRYSEGETQSSIAESFKIYQPYVSRIVNGKAWANA